jgi:Mg-chelatase subunit ChlD
MTTTMDIAVCLDCSSSIAFYSQQIRSIILSILRRALGCHQSDVRMALVEFLSHLDDWITRTHPFTSSINTFQEWINAVQTKGGYLDESKAIGKKKS